MKVLHILFLFIFFSQSGFTQAEADLRRALDKYDLEAMKVAVQAGANVNHVYADAETPLCIAAAGTFIYERRMQIATWLLEQGAEVNIPGKRGRSPLHAACGAADYDMVNLFLEKGALLDMRDAAEQTPLHAVLGSKMGLGKEHIRIAQLLLDRGAEAARVDSSGNTPFHLACAHKPSLESPEVIDNLVLDLAKTLYKRKVKTDLRNAQLKSPLYYCIENEYGQTAAYLLEKRASIAHPRGLDRAMLHLCAEYGNVGLTSLLLSHGADPNLGLGHSYGIGKNDYFIPPKSTPLDIVSIHLKESKLADQKKQWKEVAKVLKKKGGRQITFKEYMRRMH